jgi:hypothetical protein
MPIPPPSRTNPEVPREVDHIVLTALQRDPDKRWQRAADMRAAIASQARDRLTPQQLVAWVEWAFSQKQPLREDSQVTTLFEVLETQSHNIAPGGDLPAISEAMAERRRESVAMMPVPGQAMIQRRTRRRWVWPTLILLIVAAAAAGLSHAVGAW